MAFFTARGRLRRRAYFLRALGLYATGLLIYAIPGLLYEAEVPLITESAAVLGFFVIWYLVLIQTLLRLHDLNLSNWWALLLLLPGVGYLIGAGLQFVPGTSGPNRFGTDPKRPKTLLFALDSPATA